MALCRFTRGDMSWPRIALLLLLLGAEHSECAAAAAARHALRSSLELALPPRAAPALGARTLYAIGDVHGDGAALLRLLQAAELVGADGRWAAGDSVLVQTGDLLDRHVDDLAPLRLLRRLRRGARAAGGEVAWLLGNHEALNGMGDFTYVPRAGFAPLDRLMRRWRPAIDARFDAAGQPAVERHERARHAALAPGGLVARALAAPIALVVGETLLVHGGVRAAHVPLLAGMNAQAVAWMRGEGPMPARALVGAESPLWTRRFSSVGGPGEEPPAEVRLEAERVLRDTGCARMVVGHTPQPDGCNCACDGRVWRVDTGMSVYYGGHAELLRVDGASGQVSVCSLAPEEGAAAVWLPQAARAARGRQSPPPGGGRREPAQATGGRAAARDVLDLV